jgi:N-acyl amino acid synthase of PEP-CTERM/exosortase system
MDLSSVGDFSRFFRIVRADTPELRDDAYRIRYRVYCEEFGYEPAERFPDQREHDHYDGTASHALVVHRPSGSPASCVRLVPAVAEGIDRPLPFEHNCAHCIDRQQIERLALARDSVCEISRLAVDPSFRRRRGEQQTRFGNPDQLDLSATEIRALPLIAVSAYLAATAMTDLSGRRNVFAMMEPFLPRLLSRVGIHFTQVGEAIEYHGLRAPYFIRTEAALESMAPRLRGLYAEIHRQLADPSGA